MNDMALPTVLIVDDDRLNRTNLAEILKNECRIIFARDGISALDILHRQDITLVLLDIQMPEMDGYEVLERIKADPRTTDIAVIFISGMTGIEDEERGLLMGAADYVPKPVRPAIVRARVKVHLKLARQRRELEYLSNRDALTGIANRRFFDEEAERVLALLSRRGGTVGIALIDVDHFKQFNDHYGHAAGDDALREVAELLESHARRMGDIAARYGGEEFAILMPNAENFHIMMERVCLDLLDRQIGHELSPTSEWLTISAGGVVCQPDEKTEVTVLMRHADQLLYRAKNEGRNRAFVERIPPRQ